MLSSEQIAKNREEIIGLLTKTKRDRIEMLIIRLDLGGFFTQAGSTRYHHNYKGGLAEHSLIVYYKLKKLNDSLNLGFDEDSIIIVALMHDLCKIDNYKEENDKFTYNKDAYPGHGVKSTLYLKKYIELTDEEEMAIKFHMGAYEKVEFNWNELGNAYKECLLVYFTHVADMMSTYNF